jgi:uncharacterized OB-fold protein
MTDLPVQLLPSLSEPLNAGFWAACRQRRLEAQECAECGAIRWPPARLCPSCLGATTRLRALSGGGTIWSHARYERALHPGVVAAVPYVVLVVALDEGPLMVSRLTGDEAGLEIGAPARVVFTDVAPGVTLPLFELVH